jgi:hypothetical protein
MADFFDKLSDDLIDFINRQHMFFIATAPTEGRINLSPKGMDTFRCISQSKVGYLDLTGSGNETSAHLLENSRVTIMFCSFDHKPLILRIYGHAHVIHPSDSDWDATLEAFDPSPGMRQIMVIDVDSVQTSCGYAVPVFSLKEERQSLKKWAEHRDPDELKNFWVENNQTSIDGKPARPFVAD